MCSSELCRKPLPSCSAEDQAVWRRSDPTKVAADRRTAGTRHRTKSIIGTSNLLAQVRIRILRPLHNSRCRRTFPLQLWGILINRLTTTRRLTRTQHNSHSLSTLPIDRPVYIRRTSHNNSSSSSSLPCSRQTTRASAEHPRSSSPDRRAAMPAHSHFRAVFRLAQMSTSDLASSRASCRVR